MQSKWTPLHTDASTAKTKTKTLLNMMICQRKGAIKQAWMDKNVVKLW